MTEQSTSANASSFSQDTKANIKPEDAITFGPFKLHRRKRELFKSGKPVRVGSRAFEILCFLVERAGEVVSKETLLAAVWPRTVIEEGALRVHIAALRKILDDGEAGNNYIANIPQRGYSFIAEVSASPSTVVEHQPSTTSYPGNHLPIIAGRVIGRDELIAFVGASLHEQHFMTLTGPGGIGKTTVALAVAHGLRTSYPQGVYFIDLAALHESSQASSALAAALNLPNLAGQPLPAVVTFLQNKKVLLVLDNCEHVIGDAAELAEHLLSRLPELDILATSREPLRASNEQVQQLAPLSLPDATQSHTARDALSFSAIDLFVERSTSYGAAFAFGDANVHAVSEICRRLDGIPLAIELVASRVSTLGVDNLLTMLDDRLSLSVSARRTSLARQKTLHATLDWSYQLLTADEQLVLSCLSIFRESFSLNDALRLTIVAGISEMTALDAVDSLALKSMLSVVRDERGISYRLLLTTRAFAEARITDPALRIALQKQHALIFCDLLLNAELDQQQTTQSEWIRLHGRKIDDVRAALEWAYSEHGDVIVAVDLTSASAPLWFCLWQLSEYQKFLQRAFAGLPSIPSNTAREMRLTLAHACAQLYTVGPGEGTEATLLRALDMASALCDIKYQLKALWALYSRSNIVGNYAASVSYVMEFGRLARELGDSSSELTHRRLAAMAYHHVGDHRRAREFVDKALVQPHAFRHLLHGSAYQIDHWSTTLTHRARILWMQGQPEQALQVANEAIERAQSINHVLSLTYTLATAGCPLALWAGDAELAKRYATLLMDCTAEYSLKLWLKWGHMYNWACDSLVLDARDTLADFPFDVDTTEAGLVDMIATLHPRFLNTRAQARADRSENGWCMAEILRARALRCIAENNNTREAEGYLRQSLELAEHQGAHFWSLRTAISLGELLEQRDQAETARVIMQKALSNIINPACIQDGRTATSMLASLTSASARSIGSA